MLSIIKCNILSHANSMLALRVVPRDNMIWMIPNLTSCKIIVCVNSRYSFWCIGLCQIIYFFHGQIYPVTDNSGKSALLVIIHFWDNLCLVMYYFITCLSSDTPRRYKNKVIFIAFLFTACNCLRVVNMCSTIHFYFAVRPWPWLGWDWRSRSLVKDQSQTVIKHFYHNTSICLSPFGCLCFSECQRLVKVKSDQFSIVPATSNLTYLLSH